MRGAYFVHAPAEGLFEVLVVAKRLYKSQKAFSSGEFPVAADQWRFNEAHESGWYIQRIDLAYTYIYTGDGSFQCLGKVLGLECLVGVERISLHGDVMEKISPGRSPGHLVTLQSFDLLPAWLSHVSSKRVP